MRLASDLFGRAGAPPDSAAVGSIALAAAIYALWRVRRAEKWFFGALAVFGLAMHAELPPLAIQLAKEAVLKSFDTTIEMGLEYERKNFYLLFASEDMREGMAAFIEKRKPEWKGR